MSHPARARAAIAVLAIVLAACSGSDADPTGSPTNPADPPIVRLIGENLELLPGDEHALRIGFEPLEDAAHIIVTSRPDTARVSVCPLRALDEALPPITACRRDIGSGVREPVSLRDMRAVALVLAGEQAVRSDIRLEFGEGGRTVVLSVPRLRAAADPACSDNACNPFFELIPTAGGPFSAAARWDGPEASLILLQGRVLGRSQTSTGIPYAEPARADGVSPLSISTRLSAPAEYAVVIRHRAQRPGEPALRDLLLEIRWPSS